MLPDSGPMYDTVFVKYYSIAFAILPGVAGGLALELISTPDDNKDAQFVKSAIEWAFDSAIEDNETVSFLQMCIGLEAILGEETGRESLTETLADRCAYLLATDIEGRKKIRYNFRELYRLRSKLVHGRAMRINDSEKGFLEWGKRVLNCVIIKEMKDLNLSEA